MYRIILFISFVSIILGQVTERKAFVTYEDGQWEFHQSGKNPQGAYAWATYQDGVHVNGWDVLDLTSNSSVPDEDAAFAAGYLEGAMTHKGIWNAFMSFANATTTNYSSEVQDWIFDNEKWYRNMVANSSAENQDYWSQVYLVLQQYDGMLAGYNSMAPQEQQLSPINFMLYQLQFEIGDIMNAVGQQNEVPPHLDMSNHCSSLIKPTADGQNLFAAHVTWSTFSSMLRIYKHYNLAYNLDTTASDKVSFSSFPGTIPSGDDFYITSTNLVVIETTNDVMNMTLYKDFVGTNSVPYWIRVLVANRVATSGEEWTQTFFMYNSGTYNNQWIIVDQKLFTPGQPLQPNTLWIAEQIPGFYVAEDKTDFLSTYGYWASYNVPYYDFIYNMSGYEQSYEQYGNMYSWSECARAQIFRRDQSKVTDMEGMKQMMRYNDYQNDPLSLHDACRGISARCDLNTPWATENTMNGWSAFGGIDCKITDNTKSPNMQSKAVSGPSWDYQPPFAWTEQWESVPSYGQPKVFAFDFIDMKPQN